MRKYLPQFFLRGLCAMGFGPIVLAIIGCDGWEVILASVILSALVIARHWQNIVRLCKGTESKFHLKSKKS